MRRRLPVMVMSTLLVMTATLTAEAQTTDEPFTPFKTDTPPIIDGILDDRVWQLAPSETGFTTYEPDYGIQMVENTIVYYAYDRENLYFAYRCFDSRPDLIKTSVTARDRIRPDDWICINLDTFNDHQSIYCFYTNPVGIQMDSRATAVVEDLSADFVWYSAGRIDEEGYTIELQIPFKSIRFSYREPVVMGVIFERYISRLSQAGTYPALDPRHGPNFLTQTRPLIYEGIKHYRLVEVLPAVTYGTGSAMDMVPPYQNGGNLVSGEEESSFSLTGKFGITSHLVLDGTYNPDFSQVEADAGQVDFNRRYALFYPEKRPFFLEGREFFDFGGAEEGNFLGSVVHTRTIVDPDIGVKLTGKVGENNTIAVIYASDDYTQTVGSDENAQFSIFRYKRALGQDSFIGGFFTQRDRGDMYNRVLGADGVIRLNPSNRISFHLFGSRDDFPPPPGVGESAREGRALGFDYLHFTRDLLVNLKIQDLSDDFNTDVGYYTRIGVTRYQFGILKPIHMESGPILRFEPMVHVLKTRDHTSGEWETANALDLRLRLGRSSIVQTGYIYSNEVFLDRKFSTRRFRFMTTSQFTKRLAFTLSYNNSKKIRYVLNPYQGYGNDGHASVTYQFTDHLNSNLSFTYSDFYDDRTDEKEYEYKIIRNRNTYQINKYLFLRAIFEYNWFYRELQTDFLVSFTYIPGTVVHIGYGSLYNRVRWDDGLFDFVTSDRFLETRRGFFFKASYLWRM